MTARMQTAVVARIHPDQNPQEQTESRRKGCFDSDGAGTLLVQRSDDDSFAYNFDQVYRESVHDELFFENALEPVLQAVLQGSCATVVLVGTKAKTSVLCGGASNSKHPGGMIGFLARKMFAYLESVSADKSTVSATACRIKTDAFTDLLALGQPRALGARIVSHRRGCMISRLESLTAETPRQLTNTLTNTLKSSQAPSGSHTVVTLTLSPTIKSKLRDNDFSRLSIIELNESKASEDHHPSSWQSVLGTVIAGLQLRSLNIPFHKSKITSLLKAVLQNLEQSVVIAVASAADLQRKSTSDIACNALALAAKLRDVVDCQHHTENFAASPLRSSLGKKQKVRIQSETEYMSAVNASIEEIAMTSEEDSEDDHDEGDELLAAASPSPMPEVPTMTTTGPGPTPKPIHTPSSKRSTSGYAGTFNDQASGSISRSKPTTTRATKDMQAESWDPQDVDDVEHLRAMREQIANVFKGMSVQGSVNQDQPIPTTKEKPLSKTSQKSKTTKGKRKAVKRPTSASSSHPRSSSASARALSNSPTVSSLSKTRPHSARGAVPTVPAPIDSYYDETVTFEEILRQESPSLQRRAAQWDMSELRAQCVKLLKETRELKVERDELKNRNASVTAELEKVRRTKADVNRSFNFYQKRHALQAQRISELEQELQVTKESAKRLKLKAGRPTSKARLAVESELADLRAEKEVLKKWTDALTAELRRYQQREKSGDPLYGLMPATAEAQNSLLVHPQASGEGSELYARLHNAVTEREDVFALSQPEE